MTHKSRFSPFQSTAAAMALSVLCSSGALAAEDLTRGTVLNTPGKHIMASNVLGAADGLEIRGLLSPELQSRVNAIEAETLPQVREALSEVEAAGKLHALRGEWDSHALEAYLVALSMPGSAYLSLAKDAIQTGETDFDIVEEGLIDRLQGQSISDQFYTATIEITVLDAEFAMARSKPAFGSVDPLIKAAFSIDLTELGPVAPGAAGDPPEIFVAGDFLEP